MKHIFPCQSSDSVSIRHYFISPSEKFILPNAAYRKALRNKFAYNRPWPTEVAGNWNEILRNWLCSTSSGLFQFFPSRRRRRRIIDKKQTVEWFSSHRSLLTSDYFVCMCTFRRRGISMRDVKESRRDTISYYFNFFKLSVFLLFARCLPFFSCLSNWIYLFSLRLKRKVYLIKLLRAYFAYQANRSFLLHFDLNKLPIAWNGEARCLLLRFLHPSGYIIWMPLTQFFRINNESQNVKSFYSDA